MVQHAVDDIILQENEDIISVKYETTENINDEVDENELHKLDKLSHNCVFEIELKIIHSIKRPNDMNRKNYKEENNISE